VSDIRSSTVIVGLSLAAIFGLLITWSTIMLVVYWRSSSKQQCMALVYGTTVAVLAWLVIAAMFGGVIIISDGCSQPEMLVLRAIGGRQSAFIGANATVDMPVIRRTVLSVLSLYVMQ
jgi:hypothetical protein